MTREEQAEAVIRARGGDREALEQLATSCHGFLRKKARNLARELQLPQSDLESAGTAVFMDAVRYFDTNRGSFLNYYGFSALRAMSRYATTAIKQRSRQVRDSRRAMADLVSLPQEVVSDEVIFEGLDVVQLALVRAARSEHDPELWVTAARLGISPQRARLKYQQAFEQVAKNLGVQ